MPRGGIVDDARQAQVVPRVVHRAQVGQHILHLRPVKEADAPDDAVGDGVALEGLLQLVGLGVHPVENGVVLPVPPRRYIAQDLGGHILGLVLLVHGGVAADLVPRPVLGPELLALAALVVADDRVGGLQDVLGGAVVLLQADDPGPLVLVLKGEDILDGGPPEAVDGLVVVAHHADILPPPGQGGGQEILEMVGILVLINEYIAEFPLIKFPNVIEFQQQPDGVEDDVVEIQSVGLPQAPFVLHIDLGDFLQAQVAGALALLLVVLGQLHGVLGPGDVPQNGPGREGLVIQVEVLQNILDHPLGVGGVVDGEGALIPQAVDVPAQDAHAGRVEGGGPHVVGGGAQHLFQAGLQLSGGLIGKGDGNDSPGGRRVHGAQLLHPRPVLRVLGEALRAGLQKGQVLLRRPARGLAAVRAPAIADEVGDAVDQHGGLAAARPGQQQQGPLGGQHRLALLRVEALELQGDGRPPGLAETQFLFTVQHGVDSSFSLLLGG